VTAGELVTVRAKKAFVVLATAIGSIAWLYWGVAFALADWLRFSSPSSPDDATRQVIYMKAVKGVFYVTPEQHFWLATALLPVWLIGAVSMVALVSLKPASMTWTPLTETIGGLLGGGIWLLWMILFGFGDQVIAFMTTGSFALPPERAVHTGSLTRDWMAPIVTTITLAIGGLNVWRGWRRKRAKGISLGD
jgi:hypothetical protein